MVDKINALSIDDAIANIKKEAKAKFTESVDCSLTLSLDNKKVKINVFRDYCDLPHSNGKSYKVGLITDNNELGDYVIDNLNAKGLSGIVCYKGVLDEIKKGEVNYDAYVTTSDVIKLVAPFAKFLGSKGLMPSVKLGLVFDAIKEKDILCTRILNICNGQVIIYNTDKNFVINSKIGSVKSADIAIKENLFSLLNRVKDNATFGIKSKNLAFIKNLCMSSTMGNSFVIDKLSLVL